MNETGQKSIVIIHLGNGFAGPKITEALAVGLNQHARLLGVIVSNQLTDEFLEGASSISILKISTYQNLLGFIAKLISPWKMLWSIKDFIIEKNPDILMFPMQHALDLVLLRYISRSRISRNRIIISWVHDFNPHHGDSRILARLMMRATLCFSDMIVVLSENVFTGIRQYTNLPIIKIVHPVYQVQSPNRVKEANRNTVLFAGRMLKYKGIDRLSRAWPQVLTKVPDAKLVVAGSGESKYIFEKFGKLNNVEIHSRYLEANELDLLIMNSAVVVLPYSEASQSGILAQAASFKVPCVVTPVSGLIEQTELYGGSTIAKSMSSNDFADSIVEMLLNEEQNNFQMEITNSWENQCQSLIQQISETQRKLK